MITLHKRRTSVSDACLLPPATALLLSNPVHFVFALLILDEILKQSLAHGQWAAGADGVDCVEAVGQATRVHMCDAEGTHAGVGASAHPTAMDSGEERSETKLLAMDWSTDSRASEGTSSCEACAR
jgi:hypothetical protein